MSKAQKGIAILLAVTLMLLSSVTNTRAEGEQHRLNIDVFVNGVKMGQIPAFDSYYENNLYISLKGLAYALRETDKAFVPVVERRKLDITTGVSYFTQPDIWNEEELARFGTDSSAKYEMHVNEVERKYYSFIVLRNGNYDAFMTPVSLAMLLDLGMNVTKGRIDIETSASYSVSAVEMEESGYFQGVNALVIGDGTTGEIYYQYDGDKAFPIASITKLMTYLVFMDYISQGKCTLEDVAAISERVEKLSAGQDGEIDLTAGGEVPVSELLCGMLVASSNECALAIAEHAAGSQEAFVSRMNEKAEELGLTNAVFYNCHGLPAFEDQLVPAKIQNHMTAGEMFRLVSVIMDVCPQITEFTSMRECHLETLDQDIKNTNTLLYNMENMVGLKTGSTNKAGQCLVTCVAVRKDGELHNLFTVLFGAEGNENKELISEMSARYAVEVLSGKATADSGRAIPADPELVVKKLIQMAR